MDAKSKWRFAKPGVRGGISRTGSILFKEMVSNLQSVDRSWFPKHGKCPAVSSQSLTVMLFFQEKKRNPKALEKSEAGSHRCWAREFDEGRLINEQLWLKGSSLPVPQLL